MKKMIVLILICIVVTLLAGCSLPPPIPATDQAQAPTTVPTGSSITRNLVPQPTDVIPPVYTVTVEVGKNTVSIDPHISVIFRGGAGQEFTQIMNAIVFRSDGTNESAMVSYPRVGSELILPGTTGTDRVVVEIRLVTGETYRLYDALVPFRNLNP